ncbi:FtsW/RodA/SpoVE family cell cycle protein, partial [Eisenbergiella tayi]|nr:FtsW/RodA/SpoVE family cell cycle protein [Eisenbergiella tayi]
MEQYIIVYSKYIITLFMLLYCVLAFCRTFSAGWRGHKLDNIQGILIFLIQFIAFLTICVEKGDVDYLFFYAISQIVIFSSMMIFSMAYTGINRLLVNNMCLLLGTGFIILTRLDIAKAGKQLLIAAASLAVSMVVPLFIRRIRFWKDLTWVYAG